MMDLKNWTNPNHNYYLNAVTTGRDAENFLERLRAGMPTVLADINVDGYYVRTVLTGEADFRAVFVASLDPRAMGLDAFCAPEIPEPARSQALMVALYTLGNAKYSNLFWNNACRHANMMRCQQEVAEIERRRAQRDIEIRASREREAELIALCAKMAAEQPTWDEIEALTAQLEADLNAHGQVRQEMLPQFRRIEELRASLGLAPLR